MKAMRTLFSRKKPLEDIVYYLLIVPKTGDTSRVSPQISFFFGK